MTDTKDRLWRAIREGLNDPSVLAQTLADEEGDARGEAVARVLLALIEAMDRGDSEKLHELGQSARAYLRKVDGDLPGFERVRVAAHLRGLVADWNDKDRSAADIADDLVTHIGINKALRDLVTFGADRTKDMERVRKAIKKSSGEPEAVVRAAIRALGCEKEIAKGLFRHEDMRAKRGNH